MLFKYWTGRWRQRRRRSPSFFTPEIAEPYRRAWSVLMTRGCGCDGSVSALRNRRLAVAASRKPESTKVDRGAGGIDGSVEVAPTALDTNVGLIDTPGLVGWFEMTAQPLLQFGTVALDPAPDGRVVPLPGRARGAVLRHRGTRARVPKVPAHGAHNQLGLGLSPLEDRRSDCLRVLPSSSVGKESLSPNHPDTSSRF